MGALALTLALAPLACTDEGGGSDELADSTGSEDTGMGDDEVDEGTTGAESESGSGSSDSSEGEESTEEESTSESESEESTEEESTEEETETGETWPPCEPDNSCEDATDLGSMAGDKQRDSLIHFGTGEEWVEFRATEELSGFGFNSGAPMKVRIELNGPPGTDYDLHANRSGDPDGDACGNGGWTSDEEGNADILSLEWGEGDAFANGEDDTRNLVVHVFSDDEVCDPDLEWILVITGGVL
ncbi:hypothetical protein PPSIR1_32552 [Plesiocystis pacifica SIR-1]|uniref:Uncharacterized protein n=2 Tax=Plesiocystis pacifica TaxID=191768 RepID=A6G5P6_9BACT|nr:hypothetical protein PPSIR1_32552 [Plesiocystis pacifica SIR-1]